MSKSLSILCLFITGMLALSGCTKKNKTEYGLDVSKTLRMTISAEPPSMDWNKSTDTTSALIQDNIMDGLIEYEFAESDIKVKAALASKWTSTEKARKWTIHLRKDVKWTDGVPFTAKHVRDGWVRLLTPSTASEYAYYLYGIKNGRKFNEGKIKKDSSLGVKIIDDYTLEIELEQPMSYFPYLLTHHCTFPIRKDLIDKFGDKWTTPENLQTLGAYTLKKWDHDKALILSRNTSYYDSAPKIENILIYVINEMSTSVNLFKSKKIDVQIGLPSTELKSLSQMPEYQKTNILSIYYYGFNTKKPPFNDPNVRRAFSMAIDRTQLTNILGGGQMPLTGWVPSGMFGHKKSAGLKFNVSKAKDYLKKAGYGASKPFPKVTLSFNTNENHQRIAENVQAQLKSNLGVNLELKNEEWKVYLSSLKADTPQIFRLGWQSDYPDPDDFLKLMTSYSENNHTKWKSKTFDNLVEKAASVVSRTKRAAMYEKAQKLLTENEVPAMPMFTAVNHMLISKRVKSFPSNVMGRHKFKEAELSDK